MCPQSVYARTHSHARAHALISPLPRGRLGAPFSLAPHRLGREVRPRRPLTGGPEGSCWGTPACQAGCGILRRPRVRRDSFSGAAAWTRPGGRASGWVPGPGVEEGGPGGGLHVGGTTEDVLTAGDEIGLSGGRAAQPRRNRAWKSALRPPGGPRAGCPLGKSSGHEARGQHVPRDRAPQRILTGARLGREYFYFQTRNPRFRGPGGEMADAGVGLLRAEWGWNLGLPTPRPGSPHLSPGALSKQRGKSRA